MFSLVEVLHYIVRKGYVLRGLWPGGHAEIISKYAEGLTGPFGIALYPAKDPKWVYVAKTFTVVCFPYKARYLVASGAPETVVSDLPGFAQLRGGGHWTRDIIFKPDGSHMLISEMHAADVLRLLQNRYCVLLRKAILKTCIGLLSLVEVS